MGLEGSARSDDVGLAPCGTVPMMWYLVPGLMQTMMSSMGQENRRSRHSYLRAFNHLD